jgi:hypothetical protein
MTKIIKGKKDPYTDKDFIFRLGIEKHKKGKKTHTDRDFIFGLG